VEPPAPDAVARAVAELVQLEALTVDQATGKEALTALGLHLSSLPVDCRLGKLILLGAMFGAADEALTIAATLSSRSPFLCPPDRRSEADYAKRLFATGHSDHLTALKVAVLARLASVTFRTQLNIAVADTILNDFHRESHTLKSRNTACCLLTSHFPPPFSPFLPSKKRTPSSYAP